MAYDRTIEQIAFDDDLQDVSSQIKSIRRLWKAVITQALMDAGNNAKDRFAKAARRKALLWLTTRSDDFLYVCEMADLEPEYVEAKVKYALSRGCKWREDHREARAIDVEGILAEGGKRKSKIDNAMRQESVANKTMLAKSLH